MRADRVDRGEHADDWDNELENARLTLTPEQYAQEYECSFEAAVLGAYYGKLMAQAEQDKRICGVPYDPAARVYTAWDLGIGDATAIWFAQMVGPRNPSHRLLRSQSVWISDTTFVKSINGNTCMLSISCLRRTGSGAGNGQDSVGSA